MSTASELTQDPGDPSGEVATQTRVAEMMLISNGPKTEAPQPPRSAPLTGAARVMKKTYTRPVFGLTAIELG